MDPAAGHVVPRDAHLSVHGVVNRTQRLVLAFVALTWSTVVAILLFAPGVYDGRAGSGHDVHRWLVDGGLLVVLTVPLVFLAVAVVRRWRWAFWLLLAAFFAGLLRIPVAALQLTGHLSTGDPSWYVVLQAAFGAVQFLIALVMLTGYRRSGVWGQP